MPGNSSHYGQLSAIVSGLREKGDSRGVACTISRALYPGSVNASAIQPDPIGIRFSWRSGLCFALYFRVIVGLVTVMYATLQPHRPRYPYKTRFGRRRCVGLQGLMANAASWRRCEHQEWRVMKRIGFVISVAACLSFVWSQDVDGERMIGFGFGVSQATHVDGDKPQAQQSMLSPSVHLQLSYGRRFGRRASISARFGFYRTDYVFRDEWEPVVFNQNSGAFVPHGKKLIASTDRHRLAKTALDFIFRAHPFEWEQLDPLAGISAGVALREGYRQAFSNFDSSPVKLDHTSALIPLDCMLGVHAGAAYWFKEGLGAELVVEYVHGFVPITESDLALRRYRERVFRVTSAIRGRF